MEISQSEIRASYTKSNKQITVSCGRSESLPANANATEFYNHLYNECKNAVEAKFKEIEPIEPYTKVTYGSNTTPYTTSHDKPNYQPSEKKEGDKCKHCGANMVKNPKTDKIFCEKKCWLNK